MEAKQLATTFVNGNAKPYDIIGLTVKLFNIPELYHGIISKRWHATGRPAFNIFAPYAGYVLTVEIFFSIALLNGLISSNRNSNRTDFAYLYYLPCCQIFVSTDKLHQRTAPLFLGTGQEFVFGLNLKADLQQLNNHYLNAIPPEERKKGLFNLTPHPPLGFGSLVTDLWMRHLAPCALSANEGLPTRAGRNRELVDQLTAFTKGSAFPPDDVSEDADVMAMSIERKILIKKGSWWQLPHDTPSEDEGVEQT